MNTQADAINYYIGDLSFHSQKEGNPAALNNIERIQLHLDFVERHLRFEDVSHLNKQQYKNRLNILKILREYREAAEFPKHDGSTRFDSARRPRFIDHKDTHCAVGYLMKETGAGMLAKEVNEQYEYAYVQEMESEPMLNWAIHQGLSVENCAMIQPTYDLPNLTCPLWMSLEDSDLEDKLPFLREYRDRVLAKTFLGRVAIRTYYVTGRVIAPLVARSDKAKLMIRKMVKPIIHRLESNKSLDK